MRSEVQHHLFLASAQDPRICEGGSPRADFDGTAAGVVENAPGVGPAVGAPRPVGNRAVDERRPDEDEDHAGDEAAAFSDGSDDNGGCCCAELHLGECQLEME
jgi:hypothetical protein